MTLVSLTPPQIPVPGYSAPGTNTDPGLVTRMGSFFGTPIKGALELHDIRKQPGQDAVNGMVLENCVIEIYFPRTIVMTQITNRPGSVKEFITNGDIEVMARGRLFTKPEKASELWVQMKNLQQFALQV